MEYFLYKWTYVKHAITLDITAFLCFAELCSTQTVERTLTFPRPITTAPTLLCYRTQIWVPLMVLQPISQVCWAYLIFLFQMQLRQNCRTKVKWRKTKKSLAILKNTNSWKNTDYRPVAKGIRAVSPARPSAKTLGIKDFLDFFCVRGNI